MSSTILVPLLESYAYYMTAYWPGSKERRQSPVPATLIRIYLQAHDNAPDISCVVAITLAATTFAINSYPAATGPTQPRGDRLKRTLHVLEHYRTNRPELWDTDRLFVFGLVGLISHVDLSPLGPYPGLTSQLYDQCVSAMFAWLFVPATLPDSYTINSHIAASRQRFQPPITETPRVPGVDSNTISLYCLFIQAGLFHHELFIPALVICRFAVTKNLQDTCIRTLASLPISGHLQVDSLFRDRYMLQALFGALYTTDPYVTSATVFYFRVLVSSVMLNNNIEFSARQLALKDLVVYHEQCTGMKLTSRSTVAPSKWSIITHVGEDTMSESSLRDPSAMPPWQIQLQALKDSFEPIVTRLELPGLSSADLWSYLALVKFSGFGRENGTPKTHTERVQAKPRIEQPPGGIKVHVEDPEDPPGEEMTKTARVWKTYVREADQLDKEMVEGRNSFEDPITDADIRLVFAALFSAISTAFIIESLGDLKPDTSESSARSLLAISQKLDAILTGQQPTSLPAQTASLDDFSPSHSAVVVNILWLLSLSLSVAVSLIAMLAKEWCYKFMTGRSGPVYNQARKRQQKWNGIERWKMQELVNMLPGLMHAALLLFAVGLCIYLWDIHTGVAVVVTVVTTLAGCIYTLTTVLPLFDRFCPYSAPVTLLLNLLRRVLHIMVQYEYHRAHHSDRLESLLAYLTDILNPNWGKADSQGKADIYAHMDSVTSQILAWMIVNCEDSRSVHVAYQAIAGALSTLPLGPILECETSYSIRQHVRSLVQLNTESGRYSLRDPNMLQAALRYCRAASVLEHGEL
ncbi:transmembrane protein [Ceratobasidium sp. AG-Ba]|nr:transmembrane protein [Ceratobasidium sp. AG-Ba]